MRLSTEETAARLGVKKQTVYAYVSRGILSRERAVDGKASTFDASEVDRLRRARLGTRPGRLAAPVSSAVADVRDGVVSYRGTTLEELAASATTFERAAEILWDVPHGDDWTAKTELVGAVSKAMRQLPAQATLIDQLLAGVVMASAHDVFRDQRTRSSAASSMRTLVVAIVEALPTRTGTTEPPRRHSGKPASRAAEPSDSPRSIAERLWPRLTPQPETDAFVLDQALMLLADHGMATSTLAARLAASTRAGPHGAVIAGLGALNGPLHGAASRSVHVLLEQAEEEGPEVALSETLRNDGVIPGIGHFIHRTSDPRFDIMMSSIAQSSLDSERRAVVEDLVARTSDRISAPHNIDFALGSFTYAASMKPDAGELIFALARIAGWVAHALEEYEEAPLRFRPIGRYRPNRPRPAPSIE